MLGRKPESNPPLWSRDRSLPNLHDVEIRASDTGTQARGGQETGTVQRGTGFCVVRKAASVGVPTKVPTVRIEAMISSFPKFSRKNGGPGESRTPDKRLSKKQVLKCAVWFQ